MLVKVLLILLALAVAFHLERSRRQGRQEQRRLTRRIRHEKQQAEWEKKVVKH